MGKSHAEDVGTAFAEGDLDRMDAGKLNLALLFKPGKGTCVEPQGLGEPSAEWAGVVDMATD
jgi:hypothetical protein